MGRLIILFSYTVIIFCNSLPSFAQSYFVPDSTFRHYLTNSYPFSMSGDSLITDSITLAPITAINVQNIHITDLSGIEYFTTLDILNCYSNQLTVLPSLPPSLKSLYCYSNQLTVLSSLPPKLKFIGCGHNLLTYLPPLPSSIVVLDCEYNQLNSLPVLPDSISTLLCSNNSLIKLPALPQKLSFLNCFSNGISSLPILPAGLQYLHCGLNNLDSLPNTLPSGLIELECNFNNISVLPPLPSTLQLLSFAFNNISSIPIIPGGLTSLVCYSNKLDFADIVPVMTVSSIQYAPQDSIEISLKDTLNAGNNFSAVANTNANPYNIYKWFKNNQALLPDPRFSGIISDTLVISPLQIVDAGSYHCKITNSKAPDLTLYRRTISLFVNNIAITGLSSASSMVNEPVVYPNPAADVLNLSNPSSHIVEAKIMDLEGIVVWKNLLMPNNSEIIDLKSFKRGFYFLVIEEPTRQFCMKIIIQ